MRRIEDPMMVVTAVRSLVAPFTEDTGDRLVTIDRAGNDRVPYDQPVCRVVCRVLDKDVRVGDLVKIVIIPRQP